MAKERFAYKLRCTQDYAIFAEHQTNRNVEQTDLLEASMITWGFDPGFPIRVIRRDDSKLHITHGHRRFTVARQLGEPVWFVESDKDIPLFESEASAHTWSLEDYTRARARNGDAAAQSVLDYHEASGIPLLMCLGLVGGGRPGNSRFGNEIKRGVFAVGDLEHAKSIQGLVSALGSMGVTCSSSGRFVAALSRCLDVPTFNPKKFLEKAKSCGDLIKPCRDIDGYLNGIESVYNHHVAREKQLPLAFLANKAARARRKGAQHSQEEDVEQPVLTRVQVCSTCKAQLPLGAFRKDRTLASGHRPRCRNCEALQAGRGT